MLKAGIAAPTERLRILHVIHDVLPRHQAGSEIYAFELCRELSARHHVHVLCAEYDPARRHGEVTWRVHEGLAVIELVNNWVCASFADSYRSSFVTDRISHVLRAVQPDVIHIHSLLNLSFALPAIARARGIPVVATLHDYTLVCPSGGQRVHRAEQHVCEEIDPSRCSRCFPQSPFAAQMAVARVTSGFNGVAARVAMEVRRRMPALAGRLARAAQSTVGVSVSPDDIQDRLERARKVFADVDLFVAPSPALAAEFRRLGIDSSRLRVSDYGFVPLGRVNRRPPGGRLRIGYVGTLVWHKGVHVLVDAVRALPAHAFELKIFGDGNVFPDYAAELRAKSAGLPVQFMDGFARERVAEVYAQFDVLVVPSLWLENSPLVIHEAWMAGVPVIGSRMGGIADLIAHGENGLLYDAGVVDQLTAALRRFIDNPELLVQFARNLPRVKSIEADAREWEDVYGEVLESRRTPQPSVLSPQSLLRQRASSTPRVSIILPTRNGASTLPGVLDMLSRQRVEFPFEIVAVDSSSTDGTAELLQRQVDRFISIPPEAFNHGLTRNLGIEQARGELLVLLVQDAQPSSERWLAELIAPFDADPTLAGAFARQFPRPDASALTRHYLRGWVTSSETPRTISVADEAELLMLPPMERLLRCAFDNVCSCIRRSVWERHPFRATPIAEDLEWALEVLRAGHRLEYVPLAAVVHSHERPARYEFDRTYVLHRRLFELFGLRTVPTLPLLARAVAVSLAAHLRCQRHAPPGAPRGAAATLRACALAFALPLGQYMGGWSAATGRNPLRPRNV